MSALAQVIPSPNSVAFAYPSGNELQTVNIEGVSGFAAAASTADGNNWLMLSAGFQTGLQVTNFPMDTQLTLLLEGPPPTCRPGITRQRLL